MLAAVVTAGGRLDPAFAQLAGTEVKALLPLRGRPLIYYPLCALSQAPSIGRIAVVGPAAALQGQPGMEKATMIVEEAGGGVENMLAAFRAIGSQERILISASDVPHLTPAGVEEFIAGCPEEAEICYAVVRHEAFEARYPGVHHLKAKLREGRFTGGSLAMIRPEALEANMPLISRTFQNRKSKLGMVRILGLSFVVKFMLGSLSIREIEERGRDFTGCVCRAVICEDAGVAFDIDDSELVAVAEQGLE